MRLVLYSEYDTHISTPVSILMVITTISLLSFRVVNVQREIVLRGSQNIPSSRSHTARWKDFCRSEQFLRLDGEAQAKLKKLNRASGGQGTRPSLQ